MSQEDTESITFEERNGMFFIVKEDSLGHRSEFPLSESSVLAICQILPSVRNRILSRKVKDRGDVYALCAMPVAQFSLSEDLHGEEVLIELIDKYGNKPSFSLAKQMAVALGQRLIARTEKMGGQEIKRH